MIINLVNENNKIFLRIKKGKIGFHDSFQLWLKQNGYPIDSIDQSKEILIEKKDIQNCLVSIKNLPEKDIEHSIQDVGKFPIFKHVFIDAIIRQDVTHDNFETITNDIFSKYYKAQALNLQNEEFNNSNEKQAVNILKKISTLCNEKDFWMKNTSRIAWFKNKNTAPNSIKEMRKILSLHDFSATQKLKKIIDIAKSASSIKHKRRSDNTQNFYETIAQLDPLQGIANISKYDNNNELLGNLKNIFSNNSVPKK